MKRIIDDPTAEGRDLVEALRKRASLVEPALQAGLLAKLQSGAKRPAVPRVVKPVVFVGGAATVGAIVVAAVVLATRRPPPPRHEPPRAVEQAAPVAIESPPDLAILPPPDLAPPRHAHRPAPTVAPEEPEATQPDAEESRLLLDAYRALRRDHDAATALARVDEYLQRYPHGALTEEALVLAFDAADPALAARYAQKYVARFPEGEHIARAKKLAAGK